MEILEGQVFLWRGGLPPFGCAAVVNPADAVNLTKCRGRFATNGGKPPRHKSPSFEGTQA